MGKPLRILLVEDSVQDATLATRILEASGLTIQGTRVEDAVGLRSALGTGSWDLVITDHRLPSLDSAGVIAIVREVAPDLGCIIMSGQLGETAAIAGMRAGADDYVLKDHIDGLPGAVQRTLRLARERRERQTLALEVERRTKELQSLVASAPVGIITVDLGGLVRSANPAAEAMFCFPEGLSGRHFLEFLLPEDRARATALFERLLAGTNEGPQEWRARRGDGDVRLVEVTTAILTDRSRVFGITGIVRDISERRAIELELARNEAQLRTLVAAIPEGILTLDRHGVVLSCNRAMVELLRLPAPCVGRSFEGYIFTGDRDTTWLRILRQPEAVEGRPQELRLLDARGQEVEVEIAVARLPAEGGTQGLLGIVRDVGARNVLLRQLVLQEERFRLVTQATTDGVYDWERATGRIWWSEGAGAVFGSPPRSDRGISWWEERLHPEDRARVIRGLEEAMQARATLWRDEYRIQHADGSWRDVTDRGLFLYDGAGEAQRMIGAMADISERRRAEREQARLQRAITAAATDWTTTFDAVPIMIVIVGADGRIRRVNRMTQEALGRPYGELVGRSLAAFDFSPWPAAAVMAARALQGEASIIEAVQDHASGRSWSILAARIPNPDQPQSVLFVRETTEMLRMQQELESERSMSRLGSLVAGVAHEVRNPLFAISATLDAFDARYGGQPEFSKYARNLRVEVDRLSALMRDLLEYGRPPKLRLVEGELVAVIRDVIAHAAPVAKARQVRILARGVELPCRLRFDAERTYQILQNLLANALAHTPLNSTVLITVGRWTDDRGTAWVRLSVEDEGLGFRTEDLPHVFEPFFSRRRGGIGLGLSLVERFVRQHGGRVAADNRVEGGARVVVLLPAGAA